MTGPLLAALVVALATAAPPAAAIDSHGLQQPTDATLRAPANLSGAWLPWLGCWEPVSDAVDGREAERSRPDLGPGLVCITARADGEGVGISTLVDGVTVFEESLVADDETRSFRRDDCRVEQRAGWSADRHRLFVRTETVCDDGGRQSTSEIGLIGADRRWIDIEVVDPGDGERQLFVRRYRRVGAERTLEAGVAPLPADQAVRGATARTAASTDLDVGDVIEALARVETEAVEAAILETESAFALDSETLMRLADADVPPEVVDLMVAMTYPDDFVVERHGVERSRRPERRRPYYGPHVAGTYGPWYWGPWFYGSYYPYYAPFGFGSWGYYRYRGHHRFDDARFDRHRGAVIEGRGYTRVRHAAPRSSRSGWVERLLGTGGSGDDGDRGGGSTAGGRDGGGRVSPEGHRGGSESGRTARPRGGDDDEGGSRKPHRR